ncbi:hypothetical protein C8T65DRAFT_661878 [Cerioporus squamosus]|nr:hypothetical protein C8T65DRAFT_661878 [Cerioporus squamosus]
MTPLSSPTDSQRDGSADHSAASQGPPDRPERSRNAKGTSRTSSKQACALHRHPPQLRPGTAQNGRPTLSRYLVPPPPMCRRCSCHA